MISQEIAKRVVAHYAESNEPLLLSSLGKTLRVEGLWPVASDPRSLIAVVSSTPGYSVIRDEKSPAYAVVVPKDKEKIAHDAISLRHEISFLKNLPRSVVYAFVADVPNDEKIYLPKKPPFKYFLTKDEVSDEFVVIEGRHRIAGLGYLNSIENLEADARGRLATNIREWARSNGIQLERFYRADQNVAIAKGNQVRSLDNIESAALRTTALERLQSAQPEGIRAQFVIPLDIALTLSRIP